MVIAILVNFGQSMYIVNESNGSVQVLLTLSGPASIDITINVFNTARSATGKRSVIYAHQCCNMTTIIWNLGGVDYNPVRHFVEIPAGMSSIPIEVFISDNIFENNETFTMTIDMHVLRSSVSVGNRRQTLVVIVDDDRK